jgi:hypothetical protein
MTKTIKKFSKKSATRKNKGSNGIHSFEKEIVVKFLETLNLVKLYHWKTHSYATHKATDELYDNINKNIDSFVEVLLGKYGGRVDLTSRKSIQLKDFASVNDFKRELETFKKFLIALNYNKALKSMSNTDLFNIRDELLGHVNQFLYLLSFK